MKTKLYLNILILVLFTSNILAQLPKKTDCVDIKAIITEIASDAYKGRKTGSQEGVITEDYFAKEFKKLGLLPAVESETSLNFIKHSMYL
jgi:hypothetical protein